MTSKTKDVPTDTAPVFEAVPVPDPVRKTKEPNPYQVHADTVIAKMNDENDENKAIMFPPLVGADDKPHDVKYVVRKLREYAREKGVTIHTRHDDESGKFTVWATEKIVRARKK